MQRLMLAGIRSSYLITLIDRIIPKPITVCGLILRPPQGSVIGGRTKQAQVAGKATGRSRHYRIMKLRPIYHFMRPAPIPRCSGPCRLPPRRQIHRRSFISCRRSSLSSTECSATWLRPYLRPRLVRTSFGLRKAIMIVHIFRFHAPCSGNRFGKPGVDQCGTRPDRGLRARGVVASSI